MGSYTDRDGLAVITDNVWGPDGYPLDVDGNPIYFVDENGDTVSSGKDIAVYNYAGVGSDPFRTSSLIINAWSGKDGTPLTTPRAARSTPAEQARARPTANRPT
ncbi:hypothetical protein [Bifidobacterium pseudocatenulatum]|uniref:hypothetical protein n=1 Tax=Bifidobacterium pseudocatenulatum TaxID=28026 RepID=UPI0022E5EA77|nr:hypothetical protein [Bifidobacterium pseudocatenulatum]